MLITASRPGIHFRKHDCDNVSSFWLGSKTHKIVDDTVGDKCQQKCNLHLDRTLHLQLYSVWLK